MAEYSFSILNFSAKIVVVVAAGIACTNTRVFITIVLSLRMLPSINTVKGNKANFTKAP